MLIGPAAARPGGQSTGAGGYADLLNLQTMTIPSLAFAATAVCTPRGRINDTILTSLLAGAPCPIRRVNVSLVVQKQHTRVQQLGVLSADHLNRRILEGRGAAITSSMVESVRGLTFPPGPSL